jgi:hypothetical protein
MTNGLFLKYSRFRIIKLVYGHLISLNSLTGIISFSLINVFHNFSGEFLFENKEIFILISLIGSCWELDNDPNIKYLYLSEEFVTADLKIDLNALNIPAFDEEKFSLRFFKRKDSRLERLEIYYFDDEWKNYILSDQQFEILKEYVDAYFIPILNGNLDLNEEDEYFDLMDIILDEFEEQYPEIFN